MDFRTATRRAGAAVAGVDCRARLTWCVNSEFFEPLDVHASRPRPGDLTENAHPDRPETPPRRGGVPSPRRIAWAGERGALDRSPSRACAGPCAGVSRPSCPPSASSSPASSRRRRAAVPNRVAPAGGGGVLLHRGARGPEALRPHALLGRDPPGGRADPARRRGDRIPRAEGVLLVGLPGRDECRARSSGSAGARSGAAAGRRCRGGWICRCPPSCTCSSASSSGPSGRCRSRRSRGSSAPLTTRPPTRRCSSSSDIPPRRRSW